MLEPSGRGLRSVGLQRPTSASRIPPHTPLAELCPGVGRSRGLSFRFAAQRDFHASSHTCYLGPRHSGLSPRLASQSAASAVPLPRLRKFLDPQLHSPSRLRSHHIRKTQAGPFLAPSSNPRPQPRPHSRVPSKRVAIVSRKVFCGASNPFMTGMASGREFEARRWGAFSSAGPKGARCRRGRGAPCARLPPTLSLTAAASLLRTPQLSPGLGAASVVLFPTGQILSPGVGPRPPRGPTRGGATSDTRTSLCGPPWEGERPTRVSGGENSGHAYREKRFEEVGRGLSARYASSRVATPPSVVPWLLLWLRPTGFPTLRPRWEWYLVHSAACPLELDRFAASSEPCVPL